MVALVVWRADLYRDEAHRQLSDTAFYSMVDRDLTPTHQPPFANTINTFLFANGDLPHTAKTSFPSHLAHLSCTSSQNPTKPDNPGKTHSVCLLVVPTDSSPVILIMLWHPWLGTYLPTSRIPNMLSRIFSKHSFFWHT